MYVFIVIVRGFVYNVDVVREGIVKLMEFFIGNLMVSLYVYDLIIGNCLYWLCW